jgi:mutator protein MutT
VIEHAGRIALARNEREEWELPGGRLEAGEEPEEAVVREVREELGLTVRARELVDAWTYTPDGTTVVIVVYACELLGAPELTRSDEHSDVRWIAAEDVGGLPLPDGYKRSIARARGQ